MDYLNADIYPKLYFQQRDSQNIFIGLGAIPIESGKHFFEEFKNIPEHVFFFLTQDFYSKKPILFLPRYQIHIQNGKTATYDVLNKTNSFDLKIETKTPFISTRIQKRQDNPEKHDWNKLFLQISKNFQNNVFKKIVPAREVTLDLDQPVSATSLFEKIAKPNSYNFFLQFSKEKTFLGSSPERLLKSEKGPHGTQILTEALAGTRTKDKSSELLQSKKDLYEHNLVVEDILQKLKPFATSVIQSDPYIIESKNLAHLKTSIEATSLSDPFLELIEALHPTSAVCGMPKGDSLGFLRATESFERGFYAAPFGVFNRRFMDLCVAIRSCVVEANKVRLYSGVGVVPESNPELEWQELDFKIQPYIDLLNGQLNEQSNEH